MSCEHDYEDMYIDGNLTHVCKKCNNMETVYVAIMGCEHEYDKSNRCSKCGKRSTADKEFYQWRYTQDDGFSWNLHPTLMSKEFAEIYFRSCTAQIHSGPFKIEARKALEKIKQ